MADKEASIYIVDVGAPLAKCHNGRAESDLDWSMRYVWDKITTTAQSKRKTLCIGVLGLRTNETNNPLAKDEGYEHISVLKELGPVSLPDIQHLKSKIKPSRTINGDALSSVVVASEMMVAFTKRNKWDRRIYLITDGTGAIDGDGLDDIAARLNDFGISLTIMQASQHPLGFLCGFCGGFLFLGDIADNHLPEAWTLMILLMVSRKKTRIRSRLATNKFCRNL